MPLKDIDKDLQQKDSKSVERKHNETVYNVWQSKDGVNVDVDEKEWQEGEDTMVDTRAKSLKIGGIVIAVIVFIIIGMFTFMHFQKGFFAQDRVTLNVKSPQVVDSNKLIEIEFSYKNDNRAYLNDAQILVEFGDYFEPSDNQKNFTRASDRQGVIAIGKINGEGKDKITLTGYFVGPVGAIDDVSGTLRYIPQKTNVRYETSARSATTITSSPITLDISAPSEVVSGNLVDIVISIKNSGSDKLSDLKLILNAPAGFSIIDSQPSATSTNTWLISSIDQKSEAIITVRGAIDSTVGDVQTFRANVGTQTSGSEYIEYAQEKYSPRIVKSPIHIGHEILDNKGGIVHAGERMKYEIEFVNNGDAPLRDAIVAFRFDTKALDFSKLQLNGKGNFDVQNQIITWKATDIPSLKSLKPKDSDIVKFSVPVFDKLPIESKEDYNFFVKTIASISSDDIPFKLEENKTVFGNALDIPVESKVNLYSELRYKEGSGQLSVGEKTVYSVHLSIDNVNNDLEDTLVVVPLPTHIQFEGGDDDIIFNDRSNELLWKIGNIEHGAGVTSDQIKTVFNVSIMPSVDQIGKAPIILQKQVLTAKDKFTNTKISVEAEKKITSNDARGAEVNTVQE